MQAIKAEMEERNITAKFLGLHEYFKDFSTEEIDERRLVDDIKEINPTLAVMVICYSQILHLRFLLEGAGIFSEVRINRDICLLSKGQILTMSETQKKFLQTMAQPENIEKRLVRIEGQVGSGKTILGIEVLKMKLSHYIRSYGLNSKEGKQQLKVIVSFANSCHILKTRVEQELHEDIGNHSTFEVQRIRTGNHLKKIIRLEGLEKNFRKIILLLDECSADNMPYLHDMLEQSHGDNIDCILCLDYYGLGYGNCDYVDMGYEGKEYVDISSSPEELIECVSIDKNKVSCRMLQCQRSSQQILDLANFIIRHGDKHHSTTPNIKSRNSFNGEIPTWLEIANEKEFVQYAKLVLSSLKDVLFIYESREDCPKIIRQHCSTMNWICTQSDKIRGSEASVVIYYVPQDVPRYSIFDVPEFCYECLTRAKHQLIIVTTVKK